MKPVEVVVVDEPVSIPDELKDNLEKQINYNLNVLSVYRLGYENCFTELSKQIEKSQKDILDQKELNDEKINSILDICLNHEHKDREGCKICDIGVICQASPRQKK